MMVLNLPASSCSRRIGSRVIAQPMRNPGAPWHFDNYATETIFGLDPATLAVTGLPPYAASR